METVLLLKFMKFQMFYDVLLTAQKIHMHEVISPAKKVEIATGKNIPGGSGI